MAALYRPISLLNRLTVRLWMDCQRRSAAAWSLSFAIRRQNSLSAIVDRANTGTGGWGTTSRQAAHCAACRDVVRGMVSKIVVVLGFRRSCEERISENIVDGPEADAVACGRFLAGVAVLEDHFAYAGVAVLDVLPSDGSALDAATPAGFEGVELCPPWSVMRWSTGWRDGRRRAVCAWLGRPGCAGAGR